MGNAELVCLHHSAIMRETLLFMLELMIIELLLLNTFKLDSQSER